MRRKTTAKDVARLAGVSQSAVSRYFTPGASVSEATGKLIRKAADTLGYRPNTVARSLITGRSKVVGLIIAYFDNQFYPAAVEAIARRLHDKGYNLQVFISSLDATDVDEIIETVLGCQLEGVMVASVTLNSNIVERCRKLNVPVVLFNRSQDDLLVSAVTSDNIAGGKLVAEHLIKCGYNRLGYIAGLEDTSTQRDREQGFLMGLRASGMSPFSREKGDFSYEEAQNAARRMFCGSESPDAVFVANDHMAIAVMDVLRFELNLNIPNDVGVVGYDDITPAAWPSYNLTTVRQPCVTMAEATVNLLLDQINESIFSSERVLIQSELVHRGSTRSS